MRCPISEKRSVGRSVWAAPLVASAINPVDNEVHVLTHGFLIDGKLVRRPQKEQEAYASFRANLDGLKEVLPKLGESPKPLLLEEIQKLGGAIAAAAEKWNLDAGNAKVSDIAKRLSDPSFSVWNEAKGDLLKNKTFFKSLLEKFIFLEEVSYLNQGHRSVSEDRNKWLAVYDSKKGNLRNMDVVEDWRSSRDLVKYFNFLLNAYEMLSDAQKKGIYSIDRKDAAFMVSKYVTSRRGCHIPDHEKSIRAKCIHKRLNLPNVIAFLCIELERTALQEILTFYCETLHEILGANSWQRKVFNNVRDLVSPTELDQRLMEVLQLARGQGNRINIEDLTQPAVTYLDRQQKAKDHQTSTAASTATSSQNLSLCQSHGV